MMRWKTILQARLSPWVDGGEGPIALLPAEIKGTGGDRWLLFATAGLVSLGLAMVVSATAPASSRPLGLLENQLLRIGVGIGAFAVGRRIDYHRWGRWAPALFVAGILSLLLVYMPGLGHTAGHARRWISIGGVTLQPADFARLGLVVYLAFLLSKPRARLERFTTGILPCLVALGMVDILVLLQPNLSTTLAFIGITGLMLVAGGIPLRHMLLAVAPAGAVLPFVLKKYQLGRLVAWLEYWREGQGIQSTNYQLDQSLLAIGSGGVLGRGLGESRQKWFFLPDAHTDFIFAMVGEELGLWGSILVVTLLGVLLWRAYEAARRAPDRFGMLLATGIGVSLAVYAGTNLLVATGIFPTTGLPLPLVSYGGSALLTTLFFLGVLSNIASQGDRSPLVVIGDHEE
jgi:cell division protein FtsW